MTNRELDSRDIFAGVRPSKQAQTLVTRAFELGLNPIPFTQRAGQAATQEGRSKVGLFGEAGKQLAALKSSIRRVEDQIEEQRASMKTNNRY